MHLQRQLLTIHVPDLDRSRAFYSSLPGARLIHDSPRRFTLLRIGGVRLGLFAQGTELPRELRGQKLPELPHRLRLACLPHHGTWSDGQEREYILRDPDGNELELVPSINDSM